jgi:predicted membrane channel-forming protein YqfA (hemolysin III family)
VYLIVIGWMYVVLMMSVAEATNTTGSVLGAIVTFFLYGLLPVAIIVYVMRTPQRRRAIKAREAAEDAERAAAQQAASAGPDAGGEAAGAAEAGGVAAVRKEP